MMKGYQKGAKQEKQRNVRRQGRGRTGDEMTAQEIGRVRFKTNFLKDIDGSKFSECDNMTVMKEKTLSWGVGTIVTFSEGARGGSRRGIQIG
jgi:hypothetical protein